MKSSLVNQQLRPQRHSSSVTPLTAREDYRQTNCGAEIAILSPDHTKHRFANRCRNDCGRVILKANDQTHRSLPTTTGTVFSFWPAQQR